MRIHLNLYFRYILPLLLLLLWSGTAKGQYNPTDPPEPGVYFTLTTHCIPEEAGYAIYGDGRYAFGYDVGMRIYTSSGYRFLYWENDEGTVVSTVPEFTYVMPAKDVNLTARFVYDPDSPAEPSTPEFKDVSFIDVKMNPEEGGYMYGGAAREYEVGTTQTFSVAANSNYRFVNWTRNGIVIGTDNTLEFTVPKGDQTLVANFAYDPANPGEPSVPNIPRYLTVKTNPEGAGVLWGEGYHNVGSQFSVAISTNTYYHFVNWTDENGNVVADTYSFAYTMPDRHVTLTANCDYIYDPSSPGEPGTPNPDSGMAENMVLWPRMGMYDDTHVQILCETPGATIHYTLDGSTPNAESPVYTEPVFVPSNLLVKAIAYKEGMEDSPVVSYQVTAYKTGTPIFTFENLKLKITSSTPDAIIRYTTDFTDPTEESTVYTEPFEPEENCRIKAYASKEGLTDSPINIFVFRRADYTIPAPTFMMDEQGRLVIIPSVEGGETHYTLDGSDPTQESPLYTEPLLIDGNFRIKAYTLHPNFYDSPVGEYSTGGFRVETPTCSYADLALTLTSATAGATIRYTLDGTIPTEEAAAYTVPLRLTEDCKVVARGFKENYEPSDTISYTFVYRDHQVAAPEMTYDNVNSTVSITCATEGAEILYGIDDVNELGFIFIGPFGLHGNRKVFAKARKEGMFESEISSLEVSGKRVPAPTASFANKLLTLECEDSEAEIHYTTDGSVPSAASALYESPVALPEDCTVQFIAVREYFLDSEIVPFEFKVADYQVSPVYFAYDYAPIRTMTMGCDTEGAEIRYTIDGEAPTETTGTKYEGPFEVWGNHTFVARAFRSDLFPSVATELTVSDQTVPTPSASFANKLLTLQCEDSEAEIHYTTDGTAPSAASALYESPVALTEDCTVQFIAVREYFLDSEIGSYEFKVADHQVATPEFYYDEETMTVTISCSTEGAEIRYTADGSVPTETTGILYVGPIAVEGNVTFMAVAFRVDLFPSEPGSLTISDHQVPTPTAYYSRHAVTIECEDPLAQIRYTLDGTRPTSGSALYDGPIPMTEDCRVRFYATRYGYNDSEEGSFSFVLADWQEKAPAFIPDYRNRRIHFDHPEGLSVMVDIDGDIRSIQTPDSVEVDPAMRLLKISASAADEDHYDSPAIEWAIPFHKAPTLTYDGHAVHYSPAADEAYGEYAEGWFYVNGELRRYGSPQGEMEMLELCRVSAYIQSDHAFRSDDAEMTIDFFNTGRVAGARNGHRLSEAFGGWGDSKEDYTYLRINGGEITREDLEFIATLPNLTTLHLAPHFMEKESCDNVFAGTAIETIYSYGYPQGMLKGMDRLTTVIWGITTVAMPGGRLDEAGNPNILLWVNDASLAPYDAHNVVVYDYAGEGIPTDPNGPGVTGHAAGIKLEDGYPFQAHMPITADFIEFKKRFSLPTGIGEPAGWESIVLPFPVKEIEHESKGRVVPFAAWDGNADIDSPAKPFWLYRSSAEGWKASPSIEAGVPYIISMPNNAEYMESFNLPGEVTFYGRDVTLGTEESMPGATDWVDGLKLNGTYMPVMESGIGVLNVGVYHEGDRQGSAFIAYDRAYPFSAYLTGPNMPSRIPVFGDWTGVLTPTADASGIIVETPAPGTIRVSSGADCHLAVVTPDGATVRRLFIRGGEPQTAEGLTPGLYIVAGRKVMVR